jgi:RNA polymerase sigma factor (sigma-70 family)
MDFAETETPWTPADRARCQRMYHFCRLQLPGLHLSYPRFQEEMTRTYNLYAAKATAQKAPTRIVQGSTYLENLYPLDWWVAICCLDGDEAAWQLLFSARTSRSDALLVDALRLRAHRLYPGNEEQQETAVTEFWSELIVTDSPNRLPILARYDGQRPLAPWLIRVFQNLHLSQLRRSPDVSALPDDDLVMPMLLPARTEDRWHEVFCQAARAWLDDLDDKEQLLLGLLWRYRMSQREVAQVFNVHEGTISRLKDKLRDHALKFIGNQMREQGWSGDDLEGYFLREMTGLMLDDPRFSAESLRFSLAKHQKRNAQP